MSNVSSLKIKNAHYTAVKLAGFAFTEEEILQGASM